jgi:hydroxylaminobenzene mutase
MIRPHAAVWLALNGAGLMLAGLVAGALIPVTPYPRLMLSAHNAGFTVSGTLSIVAALLLGSALATIPPRAASVVVWGHVALWALSLSEVAAAFWGTNQALPLAAAEAGAPGGAQWQETFVTVCHVLPALVLLAAWAILVWGVWQVAKAGEIK